MSSLQFHNSSPVLDEADRILDMGFSRTLSARPSFSPLRKPKPSPILPDFPCRNLSSSAQTLQILPKESTHLELPASLEQHYAICSLKSKIDVLWSFIKSHLQSKTLIFLSFMRFIFEAFRRLHPGTPLLHMHGQQSSRCSIRAWRR
jgi:ATP-dependent RNA helicase DDX10/DBP4